MIVSRVVVPYVRQHRPCMSVTFAFHTEKLQFKDSSIYCTRLSRVCYCLQTKNAYGDKVVHISRTHGIKQLICGCLYLHNVYLYLRRVLTRIDKNKHLKICIFVNLLNVADLNLDTKSSSGTKTRLPYTLKLLIKIAN